MNKQIQRLRFFDGEYVRAYDFTDEQTYHVEMRRRLNHRLHLHGIVYGLQIVQDEDSVPPLAVFYSILQGMAIDQLGREIFVSAPYSLSSSDVLKQAGLQAGEYEVWLCYDESESGFPAAGYRDCNAGDQHTRWREAFRVVLRPVLGTSPASDCDGVCVGTVTLAPNNNGWQITATTNQNRSYVGIRAQRVIAPDEEADTFSMSAANITPPTRTILPGYVDVLPGVRGRGNLIVEKNVVVGDDFPLDSNTHKNLPKPNDIPAGGNVNITGDLFLQGLRLRRQQMVRTEAVHREPDGRHPGWNCRHPDRSGRSLRHLRHFLERTDHVLPKFTGVPQAMVGLQSIDWQGERNSAPTGPPQPKPFRSSSWLSHRSRQIRRKPIPENHVDGRTHGADRDHQDPPNYQPPRRLRRYLPAMTLVLRKLSTRCRARRTFDPRGSMVDAVARGLLAPDSVRASDRVSTDCLRSFV